VNIALIGYGATGREIERVALERHHAVKKIFTSKNNPKGKGLTPQALKGVEVCIEFSTPSAALANIEAAARCGKNIVVGTTGWYGGLARVRKIVRAAKIGLLYAPNFSVGMNVFSRVLASALRALEGIGEYDVAIHEIHHRDKSDSPSGTALMLGEIVLGHFRTKRKILAATSHRPVAKGELHITSARVGHVPGTHRVLFDSRADSIELVHTAKNRGGFALGAVLAAEWLKGKKGIFTMNDMMGSL
jgi:4-hydroxy-tetrahydrodipicolinate reductase